MNNELRYCVACKKMIRCQKQIDRDKDRPAEGGIFYNEEGCDCPEDNGIVFTSPRTSIHQDCLIEMMEKVIEKCKK